jgi:superfamily II DNA or RNA helicase
VTTPHALIQHLAHCALRTRALEFSAPPITLGHITLLPHQVAAVHWLNHRINRCGGALLADPPGLGKTYVALAVASSRKCRPLIIAPATLRTRWLDAARETNTPLDFVSTERLSAPAAIHIASHAFVIVDEAHHLRTTSTRRHQRTTALCTSADVLLLTATPIHNHTRDLAHITSLFHLPATPTSASLLRQRLTLRRSLAQIDAAGGRISETHPIPHVRLRRDLRVRDIESPLPHAITTLPPLLDPHSEGHLLLKLGLLHALRSSDAALRQRIRHRIAVTLAIEHATLAQITPTPAITRAFRTALGDVQLAMPELLGYHTTDLHPHLAGAAQRQRHALEALLPMLSSDGDRERSQALRRLARWCTHPVVAFTQFNATASAFYHYLRDRPGIALLGGSTARITSGVISRAEVIHRLLAPTLRGRHDAVRLLITSDVLSEGLSLAGVATIVHLDLPWTAARVDQRVGRAARIGAPVPVVNVVRLPAPVPHAVHEALHQLVARKRQRMSLFDDEADADAALIHTLCRLTHSRIRDAQRADVREPPRAGVPAEWFTVRSRRIEGAVTIAVVRIDRRRILVAADRYGVRRPRFSDWSALADATQTQDAVGHVAALRRALRAYLADRELTATIADARDHRYQSRQSSDNALFRLGHVARVAGARAATASRLQLMHSTRIAADSPTTLCAHTFPVRAIRVFAGLTILPEEGDGARME